ncbi:MAG: molybdopterin-dependent oxidoreductase [Rhodospirillaceae bacterium]|nr:molybdopterin-dependent oxidoreductase [Rhodospirillaceae bacterium]
MARSLSCLLRAAPTGFVRRVALVVLLSLAAATPGAAGPAADPPAASSAPILTLVGAGGERAFDRAALEALGTAAVETSNPWVKGVARYEGVPLRRVLEAAGLHGERLIATALDKYRAEIPMTDLADGGVILALKENGRYLTRRNKGPLFIVYPFDAHPELRNEVYFSRSVWQLTRIEVR